MVNLLVLVSYKVFPAHMGGQKGVVKFYEHLKAYHKIFFAVSVDNPLEGIGFSAEKLLYPNKKMERNFFKLPQLLKIVKREKIDCIIAEHSYTGWLAFLIKKLTGTPFIIHSHNIESSRFRQMGKRGWKFYNFYEGWIHRKADFSFFKTEEEQEFAVKEFSLNPAKSLVVPYGVDATTNVRAAREKLTTQYGINSRYVFYFNGTMDYEPNSEAVNVFIEKINPMLLRSGTDFTIVISGKRLSIHLQEKIKQTTTIRYLDFVDDVEALYQACDLFLNPVVNNSGVKTKLVEAIANHCSVVSTKSGASGIPPKLCSQKLIVVEDGNWQAFADAVLQQIGQEKKQTPPAFFAYFLWENIVPKAAEIINAIVSHA